MTHEAMTHWEFKCILLLKYESLIIIIILMCIEILNIVFDLTTSSFVKIVVFYNCYCDSIFRYSKFCDGSMDHSMGQWVTRWVMGQ